MMRIRFWLHRILLAGFCSLASVRDAAGQQAAPLFPFVLPWNDASQSVTNVAGWLAAPAGKQGPLSVKNGKIYAGDNRFRFFGVNLCFAANFPAHDESREIAARLAKFGVNCVRFHHMDMLPTPDGIWEADGRTLSPGQLDRLDFLIAELKKNGVYADLNLHVSRTYPGLPTWPGMPGFFKGVDNFFPKMIEMQRAYARDLLSHKNRYTQSRYVDEPAVALIEVNNENALLHEWWSGELDGMPELYADELQAQWNAWLSKQYGDFAMLKRAWGARESPLGREQLVNGDFARGVERWTLERHEGAEAVAQAEPSNGRASLRIQIAKSGRESWHVQLGQAGIVLQKDQPYTLRFRAKADAPRHMAVVASQAHEPWRGLWSAGADLTTDWQPFQFTFVPADGDEQGRIVFSNLGGQTGAVWLAQVSLRPGGVVGRRPGEKAGQVEIFRKREFGSRTADAQRDWVRFLWQTELNYWSSMARFLKRDLKARALLVGTQMGWSPYPIQAEFDVIDSHAYWQHPHFPGRPWHMENWTVNNVPMAGDAAGGTLPQLGLSRVAGKPFICTEYNHAAPNTYSAETFPLIAAYAALQDWDGVFAFAYCHRRGDWDARRISGFFDIDQHPTKMATLPASVALFVRGDLQSSAGAKVASPTFAEMIDQLRRSGPSLSADKFGVERRDALRRPVAVALPQANRDGASSGKDQTGFSWHPTGSEGLVAIDTPRSKALIGQFEPGKTTALGDVTIAAGATRQHWAALLLTAVDGPDFRSAGRFLVTACGYCENTAMGWKNAEKQPSAPIGAVRRRWSRASPPRSPCPRPPGGSAPGRSTSAAGAGANCKWPTGAAGRC